MRDASHKTFHCPGSALVGNAIAERAYLQHLPAAPVPKAMRWDRLSSWLKDLMVINAVINW